METNCLFRIILNKHIHDILLVKCNEIFNLNYSEVIFNLKSNNYENIKRNSGTGSTEG